jgi:hypothetical protein
MFRRFLRMSGGVDAVPRREMRVMPGTFVIALFMMFGGLLVMLSSLLVVLGGHFVMFSAFVLSHVDDLLVRQVLAIAKGRSLVTTM